MGLSAQASVVIEADSGRVVYGNNIDKKLSMASTTKIMTSLLALENCNLDEKFCVTDEMVRVEGTSMGLVGGDIVTMRAIVYGMLLQSGNDAANVAAFTMAGSLEDFSKMMNQRACEIGMNNTNFVTPSGLDAPEHYSTAYDMALLGAQAIKNPDFAEICSSKTASVEYGNPPYSRKLYNHNKFLLQYEGAFGIKTGFTKKSGRCLVTAVTRDGVTLVAVTLNAPDDWNDHAKLYNYAFSKVKSYNLKSDLSDITLDIVGSANSSVGVEMITQPIASLFDGEAEKVKYDVLIKKFEYAPVEMGRIVGCVRYYLNGEVLCEAPLTVCEDVACITEISENGTTQFWCTVLKSFLRFFESL
ncbi:MAG: D-alanyl-D-alanine carboxypeptidase [Clostridia bacterium]|nr:D-alanyl-D-alanine carboxypeptidase [Clostridia bacterium]